ncbi:MAG TPA: branched-chain amino acid ABC transporter permease [Bacillota bacterium]|nr:branched-chain amino acid ABC transporter permease [Bacillota bacterium]HXL04953.1 branched-chain amino acid ABC transporter permease [Bacillota bacterium]
MIILLLQQMLNGLQLGSVYALIALGYTMVYGILRLINFAHGDIFMISCYFGFFAACAFLSKGLPTWLAFIATMMVSMLLTALVAVLIERVAYKPLRYAPKVSAVITALGIGLFLENFTLATLGPTPRGMPALLPNVNYRLGPLSMSSVQILIIIISIVLMFLLDRVVQKTMTGMAMRAVSYDKTTASVMGVPVDKIISITFAIGSAVAGAGGVLYSLAYPIINPYMGVRIGWWAFIAAVIGGIGNVRGAMLGAYILAFVEVFTPMVLPSSTYRDFVAFTVLLIVLVVRPTGLMGRVTAQKV